MAIMLGMKPRKSYKFALVGTSRSGKTTLIVVLHKKLVKKYGAQKVGISQEAARYYFSNKKIRKPFSFVNQGKVQRIAKNFEEKAQKKGFKVILSDRSVLDAVAYVHAMGDKEGSKKLHKRMEEWISTYDHFFLLNPKGIKYQTDEVRREDEQTRNKFHISFVTILENLNMPYTLISGNKKERANKMFKIITGSIK